MRLQRVIGSEASGDALDKHHKPQFSANKVSIISRNDDIPFIDECAFSHYECRRNADRIVKNKYLHTIPQVYVHIYIRQSYVSMHVLNCSSSLDNVDGKSFLIMNDTLDRFSIRLTEGFIPLIMKYFIILTDLLIIYY